MSKTQGTNCQEPMDIMLKAMNENVKLYLGDCLEIMPSIPDGSCDMILCDLPFGVTANEWDIIIPFDDLWKQYKRLIKKRCPIVLNASQPFSSALVMSNFSMFSYEWVWVKSKITGVLNAKRMPVRKHEQILVFCETKSTKTYNAQGLIEKKEYTKQGSNSSNYGERNKKEYFQEYKNWPRDVLEFKSPGKTQHPTEKPLDLLEYLIKTYTNKGATVLDNTMGSGSTGVACINAGRKFIGIEKDENYFKIAEEKIKKVQEEKAQQLF